MKRLDLSVVSTRAVRPAARRYQAWQHAAKLMLDGADAEPLTTQIEYALTLDGQRRF